jgi:hypothetical protein
MKSEEYGNNMLRSVRWHIANYWSIKAAVSQRRMDWKRHANNPTGGINDSHISDPTAQAALQNLLPVPSIEIDGRTVMQPEKWVYVIDAVIEQLPHAEKKIIKDNFWSKKGWKYVTTMDLISKETFYRKRDHAISLVAIAAAENGLVHILSNR